MSEVAPRKPAVILVHGTNASAPEDEGPQFWQRGSPFWAAFNSRLGAEAACDPAEGEVFHWSGANSEAARRRAAARLLKLLEERYEGPDGRPYHLIGHSHGGSVVWQALVDAEGKGRALSNLRSWATVGAPFLHFRGRNSLYGLAALVMAALVAACVLWRCFDRALANPGLHHLLAAAALALLGYSGYQFLIPLLAQLRAAREAALKTRAFARYGRRWLGLRSTQDEAVNGLRNSVGLDVPVAPRAQRARKPIDGSLSAWAWYPFRKLFSWTVRPLYNAAVAPEADRLVSTTIADALHGNDLGGMYLAAVTPGPLPGLDPPALAPEVEADLADEANRNAGRLIARLRALLGLSAVADAPLLLQTLGKEVRMDELIHTLYFCQANVQGRLAEHIAWWNRAAELPEGQATLDPEKLRGEVRPLAWRPTLLQLAYPLAPLILIPMVPARPWYTDYSDAEICSQKPWQGERLHPILKAVRDDDPDALRYFFGRGGSPDLRFPQSQNSLLTEAILRDRVKICRSYLDDGLLVEDPIVVGKNDLLPPLHTAAASSSWNAATLIIQRRRFGGSEINARDTWKRTPLHYAADRGDADMVKLLLGAGAEADPGDRQDRTPLHLAAMSESVEAVEAVEALLDHLDARALDHLDDSDRTPLHYAVKGGHIGVVRKLIARGAEFPFGGGGCEWPAELAPPKANAKELCDAIAEELQKRRR